MNQGVPHAHPFELGRQLIERYGRIHRSHHHAAVRPRMRGWAAAAYGWTPLLTLVSYAIVAIFALVGLDWIHRAFI